MGQRGSYTKGIAKREEILATALEVIAREGYSGASVKEISAAAGLSPAGILHYFDSKDELFTEILRKRDDEDLRTDPEDPDADPMQPFLRVMRRNAEVPGLVELYTRLNVEAGNPSHPAHRFFAERRASLQALFGSIIEEGKRTGRYPETLDPSLSLVLTAAADGLQTLWLQDPTIDMAAEIERLLISLGLVSNERSTTT